MKRRLREKGQSLTEFALLLPLLLLVVCGIFDFGRIFYAYMHLNLAAQESVRLGGLGKTDAVITQFAKDYVHLGDAALLTVTITPTTTLRKSGEYITVKLSYPLGYMTPLIATFLPTPTIEVDSSIRIE